MTSVISHFCFKTQRERVTALYVSVLYQVHKTQQNITNILIFLNFFIWL